MTSWVYVLCLGQARGIGDTDLPDWPPIRPGRDELATGSGRCAPISHYVGSTQQDYPMQRAGGHGGAGMGTCVLLICGTTADEERIKSRGRCPRCGGSLNYKREASRFERESTPGLRSLPGGAGR